MKKYTNLLLSGSSFLISTITREPVTRGMPPAVSLELTNACNLRCPECPSGSGSMKRPRGFMNKDAFSEIIRETGPYLVNANLYFQGEPMLHPDFFSFLEITRKIRTTISTNGHYIDDESAEKLALSGLNKLIVSLDGPDQETYSKYRINGDIEKVLRGIEIMGKTIRKTRSGMKFVIQVLVNRYNEGSLQEIKKIAERSGAKPALKSMQIYNTARTEEWLPTDKRFRRYRRGRKGFHIRSSLPRRCARLWFNPVITWDLKVLPCCFDKDGEHVMGDLNRNSLREIWQGDTYMKFREALLMQRQTIAICRNCTSGLRGGVIT